MFKILLPFMAMKVSFAMTGFAQTEQVYGKVVIFVVINMMDNESF